MDLRRLEADVGALVARHDRRVDLGALRRRYADDPVGFIRTVCRETPWAKQVEIAEAVRDHGRVVVRSCNGAGKDWLAGRLAVWAAAMGWFVIITGPTERQVKVVVMGEAYRAWARARLPGEFYELAWRLDRAGHAGILAFTSSDVSKLTGLHAPKVMAIITEAQGVEPFCFEAMHANLTGDPSRLLVVGNPLVAAGRFFEACRAPHWTSVQIGAAEAIPAAIPGGITARFADTIAQEFGSGSGVFRARVRGEFPEEDSDGLVRRSWLEAAAERFAAAPPVGTEEPVIGVDVARFGAAATAAAVRRGPRLVELAVWQRCDLMETVGKVRLLAERWGVRPREAPTSENGYLALTARGTIVVDEVGVGAGVCDRLAEAGYWTSGFNAGRTPASGERARFLNERAASFWTLRALLEGGEIALPPDLKLWDELTATRWKVNSAGKVALEPKDDLAQRLGRSPDRADAVAMAFGAPVLTLPVAGFTFNL